jgi:hypothetical protein
MGDVNDAILIAEATPLFPPRPDGIVTMLTSDDYLPGAQTLLYSVKVHDILATHGRRQCRLRSNSCFIRVDLPPEIDAGASFISS